MPWSVTLCVWLISYHVRLVIIRLVIISEPRTIPAETASVTVYVCMRTNIQAVPQQQSVELCNSRALPLHFSSANIAIQPLLLIDSAKVDSVRSLMVPLHCDE